MVVQPDNKPIRLGEKKAIADTPKVSTNPSNEKRASRRRWGRPPKAELLKSILYPEHNASSQEQKTKQAHFR